MQRIILGLLFFLCFSTCASADNLQVTSGSIDINLGGSGTHSSSLSGSGFTVQGTLSQVGCASTVLPGDSANPCGGATFALEGLGLLNGTQTLLFDALFDVIGQVPVLPDGSAVFTYSQPVSYGSALLACTSICPAPPPGNFLFFLTGDVGTLNVTLTKNDDGSYKYSSVVYTISGQSTATPEPGAGFLTVLALPALFLVLKRR